MPGTHPYVWNFSAAIPDMRAFGTLEDGFAHDLHKLFWLNADFARSMMGESHVDYASLFTTHAPEALYARQLGYQAMLLSAPLHYMSALLGLWGNTQRAWIDAWSHAAGVACSDDTIDVPARAIRNKQTA